MTAGRAEYERHTAPEETLEEPGAAPGSEGLPEVQLQEASEGANGTASAAEEPAASEDGVEEDPLTAARRERDEYLDALRRERAEFENFRKRANRERLEALDRGAEGVLSELLGVLDNFDRVLDAAEHSDDPQLVKGVEMVHGELRGVLAKAGLEEVPGAGAPFDPNWHEAMMQVEADEGIEQPYVFEVLRRGYRYKGRVLRPASVSVAQ